MYATKLAPVVPWQTHPDGEFETAALTALAERQTKLAAALERMGAQAHQLSEAAGLLIEALRNDGRVLIAGNGGSAAAAQHFAGELVGRFLRERPAYAAIALSADSAIVTAIANDYGYKEVFARQVTAFGQPGDVLVTFSTSGESDNLIRAAHRAHDRGLTVIAVTGGRTSRLAAAADLAIQVPLCETPLVQELHMVTMHLLCDLVESTLTAC